LKITSPSSAKPFDIVRVTSRKDVTWVDVATEFALLFTLFAARIVLAEANSCSDHRVANDQKLHIIRTGSARDQG